MIYVTKQQVIQMAIALSYYQHYMKTRDIRFLDMYAEIKGRLYAEGIDLTGFNEVRSELCKNI